MNVPASADAEAAVPRPRAPERVPGGCTGFHGLFCCEGRGFAIIWSCAFGTVADPVPRTAAATATAKVSPAQEAPAACGRRGKESDMTANTLASGNSRFLPALAAALIGLGVIILAGHVQAHALHEAAHDVRHATGFPCH